MKSLFCARRVFLGLFISIIITWSIFANLFLFRRLDVDSYHDGFLYPMALASSWGWIPNRDFFSLYGPLAPLIQGFWLQITERNLDSLRVHGAVLILIISLLFFNITRYKMNASLSALIVCIWTLGNPFLWPTTPWPDLYISLNLLFLINLLFILKDRLKIEYQLFIAGFFVSLGVMYKVNFGITALLTTLLIMITFKMKLSLSFFGGGVLSLCFFLIYFLKTDSLNRYLEQTIIFVWNQHDNDRSLRGAINIRTILFGICFILAFIVIKELRRRFISNKSKINVFVVAFLGLMWLSNAAVFRKIDEPFVPIGGGIGNILRNFLKNLNYSWMFGSTFLLLLVAVQVWRRRGKIELLLHEKVTGIICIASLSQLYPNPDPIHIWYLSPVFVTGLTVMVRPLVDREVLRDFSVYVLTPMLFGLVTINMQQLSIQRIPHTNSVLEGLKSKPEITRALDETLRELNAYTKTHTEKIEFNCIRGIFSVADNSYRATDYQYVDLVPKFNMRKAKSIVKFECGVDEYRLEQIRRKNIVIFFKEDERSIPEKRIFNILFRTDN